MFACFHIRLSASLEALSILGIGAADSHVVPVLATSRVVTGGIPSTDRFVRLQFDTNPLNGECDTAIGLTVQQFEVKYDAVSSSYSSPLGQLSFYRLTL